jgi:hypothetical protein
VFVQGTVLLLTVYGYCELEQLCTEGCLMVLVAVATVQVNRQCFDLPRNVIS